MSDIEKKYKFEFFLLKRFVNNNIIKQYFINWGTWRNGQYYKLHSQINIFESVFLHFFVLSLKRLHKISVLEIGCAYGTSSMIIADGLNKCRAIKKEYTVIDPNQTTQWSNIGHYNLERVANKNIKLEYVEKMSSVAMKQLYDDKRKYNLIFIDGAHDYIQCKADSEYGSKMVKVGGYVILDDVLHHGDEAGVIGGVTQVVNEIFVGNPKFQKVAINERLNVIDDDGTLKTGRRNCYNPITMHAYKKISD